MPKAATYELVYTSVATFEFRENDLTELLVQSRKFNSEHDITGLLLYADSHFMQLLEGTRDIVLALMGRINADPRHRDVRIVLEGPAPRRQFADWSMAFADLASPAVRALPGFSSFLLKPTPAEKWIENAAEAVRLLRYFKAVMMAPEASAQRLARAVFGPKAKPPRTRKRRRT